ncbi:DUF433 domain-containing protein [candidate division KSB1 bacterium]|nr:DUF433 domain-containing protein [candidate division KSB1 bacterium]
MQVPEKQDLLPRIIIDSRIILASPVIRRTRIPAEQIRRLIAPGIPGATVSVDYPHLHPEDIQAVLIYAAPRESHFNRGKNV